MKKINMAGRIAAEALRNLFRKPSSESGQAVAVPDGYRGLIVYNPDNCIACGLCVRDCPAGAIKIVNEGTKEDKKLNASIDTGRCIFCCQCVDSCMKGCLSVSDNYNLNAVSREEMVKKL